MAIPSTKHGRNMYDMLSLLQKAIRRGYYTPAAYAANELETIFRKVMWSRMLVISAEDCYGVITKELIKLKEQDDKEKSNRQVGRAIALMCKSLKSRDACYFSCNFVLDSRKPREIELSQEELERYAWVAKQGGDLGLFDEVDIDVAIMYKALEHRDMDMLGYQIDKMRIDRRNELWEAFKNYARVIEVSEEIEALEKADQFVNRSRKNGEKDEIFVSKAAMILCYTLDDSIGDIRSSEVVSLDMYIDWDKYDVKRIEDCELIGNRIPDWVFDCHTIRGKRMGKTDWDMTTDEQAALEPKKVAYFDNGSWLYTYMQDVRNGMLSEAGFEPIRKYAETHEANPVKFIPYE